MQRGLGGFPHERLHQEAIAARVVHSQRRLHLNFIIREYMDT